MGQEEEVRRQRQSRQIIEKELPKNAGGAANRIVRQHSEKGLYRVPEYQSESSEYQRTPSLRLERASSREAAVRDALHRWARDLREHVFASPEPPFEDMEEAEAEWIELARRAILDSPFSPSPEVAPEVTPEDEPGGDPVEPLLGLQRLHRQVEEELGISLPDPTPEREVLKLPDDGSGSELQGLHYGEVRRKQEAGELPSDRELMNRHLKVRVPIDQARSQHFTVARAVRRMAEFSGHRAGDLTRFVLTGAEPKIPAAHLEVRTVHLPGPSGDETDWDPKASHRYVVLRLNEPPTTASLREIRDQIERLWQSKREQELADLRELVEKHLDPEARRQSKKPDWEPIAEEWNRSRPESDQVGWRALQMRYKNNFLE